jgi:O-antigen ligase
VNFIRAGGKLGGVTAASQRLETTLHALAVLLFAAPLMSLSAYGGVSWLFGALLILLVLLTAYRPPAGLAALALVLPLSFGLAPTSPGLVTTQVTECFVLVFLVGSAARAAFDPGPSGHSRLALPALVVVLIALAAGLIATLAQFESQRAALREIAQAFTTKYFPGGVAMGLQPAFRWAELACLAYYVETAMRRRPAWRHIVLTAWLAASAATAAQSLLRLMEIAVVRGHGLFGTVEVLRVTRLSPLYGDLNAAGSLFAMLTVIAVVYAVRARSRIVVAATVPFLLFAFLATQSRAAVLAVIVTLGFLFTRYLMRSRRRALAAVVLLAVAGGFGAMTMVTRPTHVSAGAALNSRVEMGKIALKIARETPIFGVGPGFFQVASRDYLEPGFVAQFPEAQHGENAHNNFLQVLAELGLIGLAGFVWFLWRVVRPPPESGADGIASGAVVSGLAAFFISALFGHPLLVPEIATAAFFACGLAAGMAPPREADGRAGRLVSWVLLGFVLVTLPWRVIDAITPASPDVTGAGPVAGEIADVPYRVAEQQSRWRLRTRTRMVVALMRWDAAAATDCRVRIVVKDRPADEVSLSAVTWQQVRFSVPPGIRPSLPPEVEFHVTSPTCTLLVGTVTSIR